MNVLMIQPTYWPPVYMLHRMLHADVIVLLDDVDFRRRRIGDHPQWTPHHVAKIAKDYELTVPIKHGKQRQKLKDIVISEDMDWRGKHAAMLRDLYPAWERTLPVALTYIEDFGLGRKPQQHIEKLGYCGGVYDLMCWLRRDLLPKAPRIFFQSEFAIDNRGGVTMLVDLMQHLRANTYVCGASSFNGYLDEGERFYRAGIKVLVQDVQFGFDASMSILHELGLRGVESTAKFLHKLEGFGMHERKHVLV